MTHNLIDLQHDWLSRLVWLTIWLTHESWLDWLATWLTRNLIDWQLRWIRWFTTRLTCNLINSIDSPTESLTTWLTFDLIDFWLDWLVTWLTSDLIHLLSIWKTHKLDSQPSETPKMQWHYYALLSLSKSFCEKFPLHLQSKATACK